jgi:cyanophycinase-like exopeptidase
MSATPGVQRGQRPKRRSIKPKKRTKKIEVKLADDEHSTVRKKFGRLAAAIAREHWLGFRVANPTTPDKQQILGVAAALHAHRVEVMKLRRLVADGYGDKAAKLLQREQEKFNHITQQWFSNYSALPNKTPSLVE